MSMKRTTTRRWRQSVAFCKENRRLFPFAGLFVAGVALGVLVYATAADRVTADWNSLLRISAVTGGFRAGMQALWSTCFSTVVLLAALYLLGLWACGAPFVLLVPLFHGLGLGLTEAHYYAMGPRGVLAVAAVILPGGLLTAAVLVMAGAESLRLSAGLTRQLLPRPKTDTRRPGPVAGLWGAFRLYSLRFLLFLVAAFGAGIVEVLLRTVLGRLLL